MKKNRLRYLEDLVCREMALVNPDMSGDEVVQCAVSFGASVSQGREVAINLNRAGRSASARWDVAKEFFSIKRSRHDCEVFCAFYALHLDAWKWVKSPRKAYEEAITEYLAEPMAEFGLRFL